MNKAYDPLDLFSAKECIAFHLEIFVTCIFLREQTVNTLGKRLGNEAKQLYFTQLCFISFQKALCGPLPKGHCLNSMSLQIFYRTPEASSSTGHGLCNRTDWAQVPAL